MDRFVRHEIRQTQLVPGRIIARPSVASLTSFVRRCDIVKCFYEGENSVKA